MTPGIQARFTLQRQDFRLDVDLQLPGRGISALFGPSGSGKTTCLRLIAGLERAAGGRLEVNGEVWQDDAAGLFLPAHRRALGYVFQEASLFPHLSVRRNLEYGARRSGSAVSEAELIGIAERLGIVALLARRPQHLSGGERQRVAIGRALLSHPRLLLFDEPLSSLDARRKAEILPYLERLHEELEIPAIYVSHQPDEIARLADHLVLLDSGHVAASGPLQDTLARLDLPAAFTGDAGIVVETVFGAHDEHDHLTRLDFPGGSILVPQRSAPPAGKRLRCRIDARDVSLTLHPQSDTSILNLIAAVIVEHADTDHPAQLLVRLDAGGTPLLARITRRSWEHLQLAPGKPVWAQVKAAALIG